MALPHFAWTYAVTVGVDDDIEMNYNGGGLKQAIVAPLANYRCAGDGSADDILFGVKTALEAQADANAAGAVFTLTLLDSGKVTISCDKSVTITLNWATGGGHRFNALLVGFAVNGTLNLYTSPWTSSKVCQNTWFPATYSYKDGFEEISHVGATFTGGRAKRSTTLNNRIARFQYRAQDVIAQRIWPWTAAEATWMSAASLATGDTAAAGLYNMWDHMIDGDGAVYYYDVGGTERGPYYRDTEEMDLREIAVVTDPGGAYHTVNLPLARDYT